VNLRTVNLTIRAVTIFLFLLGCAARVEKPASVPTFPLVLMATDRLPSFADDLDWKSLETAISNSLQYYDRIPDARTFNFGNSIYTARELKESLLSFLGIIRSATSGESREERIRDTFDVYKSAGHSEDGEALFTGYYEPVLEGSLKRTGRYRYPIYRKPDDSIVIDLGRFKGKFEGEQIVVRLENGEIVPYFSRKDIDEKGCLRDRGLEIAWVADPVDIFFLHIQGSGMIRLSDILNHNESYVFFRIVENGPVGSLGVTLTSGRSIATDSRLYPKGALAFVRTRKPVLDSDGDIKAWVPFSRFVLNQDTGGAITGPGRVDLFCGRGKEAGIMAGHLKERGEVYFFVKKKPE
jgi:membrane-bound lytic murein transglycosylase A